MPAFFLSWAMKLRIAFSLGLLIISTFSEAQNLHQYINPMIGTSAHGHTFPGATRPFGMVQLSPDTRIDGSWDGCSGYHYSDSIIYAFSHTHLSGTGCSDYGDVAFMPGYVALDKTKPQPVYPGYINLKGKFKHETEHASAGYYTVEVNDIKVELTSTLRSGLQQYTFNKDGIACISLNLAHRDKLLDQKIEALGNNQFQGYRRSKAWAEDQLVYFAFDVSKTPLDIKFNNEKNKSSSDELYLFFEVKKGDKILVKTGLSSVNEKSARANLVTELPHWDFNLVKVEAEKAWEKEISKIEIQDKSEKKKKIFYTALYHSMIHPNILNDVDGNYRGRDNKIHKAIGEYYTLYSLWDTHRALHPLLTIIDPKRTNYFIRSFLAQYQQSGRLPMWELWNNETNCMIGFHSVSVILDAYKKSCIDIDLLKEIYPAVKAEAMSNRFGLDKFRARGYLDVEDESESVSKTLEYAYDMWCVSEIASILGKKEDAAFFGKYQHAWKNVYDAESGYMRPRKNGDWLNPFNPYEVNNHYTEANAWQYSFFVPHREEKPKNVISLFQANSKTTGREQSDITGLIGQYAHGNEPSHNYAYLLNHPTKQKYIQEILENLYTEKEDGLCGNDDCGQMSAWYVLSAMGFYPICPGKDEYELGYPIFENVRITTGPNSKFRISKTSNATNLYPYINSTKDVLIPKFKLKHHEIMNGAKLVFQPEPWKINEPSLQVTESNYLPAPVIISDQQVFKDFANIFITMPDKLADSTIKLYYSIDSASYKNAKPYLNVFFITKTTKIFAFAMKGNVKSNFTEASYFRRPNNWDVELRSRYNKQYSADGPDGIIDGLRGDTEWRKGRWQGYQSQDFEANIDLKIERDITKVSAGFLQDSRSWILMPREVEIWTSNDGNIFHLRTSIPNKVSDMDEAVQVKDFSATLTNCRARYIKIKAKNYGTLPSWHQGAGGDAFIFVDEVMIK